jgi:hypothetical protein
MLVTTYTIDVIFYIFYFMMPLCRHAATLLLCRLPLMLSAFAALPPFAGFLRRSRRLRAMRYTVYHAQTGAVFATPQCATPFFFTMPRRHADMMLRQRAALRHSFLAMPTFTPAIMFAIHEQRQHMTLSSSVQAAMRKDADSWREDEQQTRDVVWQEDLYADAAQRDIDLTLIHVCSLKRSTRALLFATAPTADTPPAGRCKAAHDHFIETTRMEQRQARVSAHRQLLSRESPFEYELNNDNAVSRSHNRHSPLRRTITFHWFDCPPPYHDAMSPRYRAMLLSVCRCFLRPNRCARRRKSAREATRNARGSAACS